MKNDVEEFAYKRSGNTWRKTCLAQGTTYLAQK